MDINPYVPRFMLLVFGFLTCLSACTGQGVCIGMTPCYCKFENGQFLHLAGLARTDGIPRFVNISDKHEMVYSWNPCFNFTEGDCEDVAICAIQPSLPRDLYLDLGYQNLTTFSTNKTDNAVTLVYKTPGNPLRTSYVLLKCVKEDLKDTYLKAIGQKEQTSTDFYFELHSPLACPQGNAIPTSTQTPPESSSINTTIEVALIAVSVVALVLLAALLTVVLKRKMCKREDKPYDHL